MKKIILILLVLVLFVMSLNNGYALAESPYRMEIERVDNNMPHIDIIISFKDKNNEIIYNQNFNVQYFTSYINTKELTVTDCYPVNSLYGSCYYFLVDISESVHNSEMEIVKSELVNFVKEKLRENDKIFLYTYGDEVNLIIDENTPQNEYVDIIDNIERTSENTRLNKCLDMVIKVAENLNNDTIKQKAIIIIGDGIDDTDIKGDKSLADIKSNIDFPKYQIFPMIFDRSNSDVNQEFMELADITNGVFSIINKNSISDSFLLVNNNMNSTFIVEAESKSNIVSLKDDELKLLYTSNEYEYEDTYIFINDKWVIDNTPPQMSRIDEIGDTKIQLNFSEPLENAEILENYILTDDEDNIIKIISTIYNEKNNSVILECNQDLYNGDYQLNMNNIHDVSMEENLIDNLPLSIEIHNNPKVTENTKFKNNVNRIYRYKWVFAIAFIVIIVVIIMLLLIIRKKKNV